MSGGAGLLPFGGEIAGLVGAGRARRRDFLGMDDERRALEEGIAAAMVGMQMRAHHHVDIVACQTDAAERSDDIVAGLHDRRHQLGEAAPARLRLLGDRRVAAGIEQHIAGVWRSSAQHTGSSIVSLRAASGMKDALAHAQAAAGEKMHLHRAAPALSTTARIALTMCS